MRGSIRRRLTLVFIGLAIGPLLVVGAILAWQSFVTQEQQALNLQREVAQHVSSQVTAFLDGLENELRLVSQVQGLQKLDRDKQHNTLAELLSYQDAFESLVLFDSQGQEQVHVARSSISYIEPGARTQADEFVIPRTSGQTYYSPVYFNETTGEPSITIAVPLFDVRTGLVDGVLVSEVRFQRIWDLIMNLRTSPGQSVYIVDAQNKVIAHRNPSVVLRGTTFHAPDHEGIQPGLASVSPMLAMDMREGLSIQSLVARLTSPNVVLAVATVRFGEQEFNIIAEQTVAEALALAINTILITASLMVGALVISVVLGLVIVRQVVQPIQAMATTAEAISAGDLSRQVQVASRDEVGVLAAAFNSMTAQLRQSLEDLKQQVVEVKQAEESLRQANETLQALIDYSPLAIIMLDLDSHVLLWNNAAEKMYGWTAQEVLGQFMPCIPEDKREEQRAIRERVTQGEVFTNLELERRRKDGSKILIGASIAPLSDATGSVYAHVNIAADITERKQAEALIQAQYEQLQAQNEELLAQGKSLLEAEQELRQLNAELEQRVMERTAQLETANKELEAFSYSVSHDLRAPLRVIDGFARALIEDHAAALPEAARNLLDRIQHNAERMGDLISDLLAFSHIGRKALRVEAVDMDQLVQEVLNDLRADNELKQAEIVVASLPACQADRSLLKQVWINLISNAIKYSSQCESPRIEIRYITRHHRTVYVVKDNGVGFDMRYVSKLFGVFQRLHGAEEYEGTGIGLAMVRRIIMRHGGTIWAEAEPGKGATFYFTL